MYLKARMNRPVQFVSGGQFVSPGQWKHNTRKLDSFEIIIGVKGVLPIRQDNVNYLVKPGEVLLLLPGHHHGGFDYASDDVSFFWFHFYCCDEYELLRQKDALLEISLIKKKINTDLLGQYIYLPLYAKVKNLDRINIIFHQLMHFSNSDYYTKYGVDYLSTLMLIELSGQGIANADLSEEQMATNINISKILDWIRAHYMMNISVTEIADQFNYNRDYLSRFFKKKTGMNLQEYIHSQKLSKAKELLLSNYRQNVNEIAFAVGFQDEKYFMRIFKKYELMTPTEFRKAYYRTHFNNH